MRHLPVCLLALALLTTSVTAQPPADTKKEKAKEVADKAKETTKTTKEEDTTAPAAAGSAFIIACDAQPSKVLVLDNNGKWLSNVKSVEIKFEVGGPGTITCVIYEGPIRPSKPLIKSWTLAQMKTITAADFQQLVDNLQTDPDAIKSLLK